MGAWFAVATLVACKNERPAVAAPPAPTVVTVPGVYHAVKCGEVTAQWSGSGDDLPTEGPAVPKSYGVTGLAFRLPDGTTTAFTPKGTLFGPDWSFDIFSSDCSSVALLEDHYGPYTVLPTKALATMKGTPVSAPVVGQTAPVLGQWTWTGPSTFEFVASCCGGARVLRGDASSPATLATIFEAENVPSGVRRGAGGWEVIK